MAHNEKQPVNRGEKLANPEELERINHEQQERINEKLKENAAEKGKDSLDDARHEAHEQAKSAERKESKATAKEKPASRERRKDGPASKKELETNFRQTMSHIQKDMSPVGRSFSKLIHNKGVDKASTVVGSTIARPNAIFFGSLLAFIFTLGFFLVARYYGYPLSGAEMIASFTIGWLVGLLIDYLRLEFTGGRAK